MESPVSFFNLSIKKILAGQPDTLTRARIRIIYTILIISILKIVIAIPLVIHAVQPLQLYRMIFVLLMYIGLAKYLLYRPKLNVIAHILLATGVITIWSNVLLLKQHINLVTLQFVFMVTFVGYYILNSKKAVVYSVLAITPVVLYLLFHERAEWVLDIQPQELPSPGFEVVVVLNFITMLLVHYLFYRAFTDNFREKEQLNSQLRATVAETKALAESRSVFLSTMSHELRTPLNAVIGMTNLIKDTATKDQSENLEILEFSAVSLLTLVNDILDYNKSENDKIELENIPIQLPALLYKICTGMRQKAAEKGFELELEVDDNLKDKWLIADPTRLTQIIYNLVGNAIKFTEQGKVCVKAVAGECTEVQAEVRFSVSDTGIGIAAERQEAIFEPFVQASADTTRRFGGTGLGLAIVKRLLRLFHSTIHLQSIPGEGSQFAFTIKFEVYKGKVQLVPINTGTYNPLSSLNILIAEDNPVNALLLVKLLSRWDVRSVVAVNGEEALDKFRTGDFNLILMDLHMPVMDGYQATLAIRALPDRVKALVPIIALSASVSHNIGSKIKLAGMNDYLSKPFQPAQLYDKLQKLTTATDSQAVG